MILLGSTPTNSEYSTESEHPKKRKEKSLGELEDEEMNILRLQHKKSLLQIEQEKERLLLENELNKTKM